MTYSIRIGLLALLGVVIGAGIFQVFYRQPNYQVKNSFVSAQAQLNQKEVREVKSLNVQLKNAAIFLSGFSQSFNTLSQRIVQNEERLWQAQSKEVVRVEKETVPPVAVLKKPSTEFFSGFAQSFSVVSQNIVQNEERFWQIGQTELATKRTLPPITILKKSVPSDILIPNTTGLVSGISQYSAVSIEPVYSPIVLKLPDHINLLNQSEALLKKTITVEKKAIPPVIMLKKPLPVPLSNTVVLVSGLSQYLNIFTQVAPHPKKGNVITLRKTTPLVTSLQAPLPALPISIQSAAVLGDEGHTQFVIRLSQKPFYIVRTDGAHQTITLMIDNVNPDISAIPPLDISGTAIQNIAFHVSKDAQFLVTLTLLPQVDVQGLRFKGNNLILDVGIGAQLPYVQSQNGTTPSSEPVQPLVKTLVPLTSDELATQNYDEAVDLLSQGNIAGATGLLEVVVTEHPSDLDARVLLARLWLQQNEPTQALNLLEGAMPQPTIQENVTFYDLLAEAYRQTGDPKSAVVMYQQLLRMDDSNGVWWVGLGMCFEALNQNAASTEAYGKALATGKLPPVLQTFISKKLDLIK